MAERNYLPQFMERRKNYSSKTRKPPGGDTNDIFGLEERQKEREVAIYEDKRMENVAASGDKFQKKFYETEDIPNPQVTSSRKQRRSLSEIRSKSDDPTLRTPPLSTGKENIGSHFKKSLSPNSKIRSADQKLEESENEDDDETSTSKKQEVRNPITGDGVDDDTLARNKLGDATNLAKDENAEAVQLKAPRRPCIRIRQPPGGASSIVF